MVRFSSRAGARGLEREDVDVGAVVRAAADALKPVAKRRRIELVVDVQCSAGRVHADRRRIREAIEHLLLRERSLAEAAAATGRKTGALKVNLHRALKSLRIGLSQNDGSTHER